MKTPYLSVILPTYNADKYLKEAIDSILNQIFQDFELIIVDDNSTDKTLEIINSYNDKRIRLLKGPGKTLAAALNAGIKESKGIYIARMDADDISLPNRFKEQIKTLQENPEIGILGTKAELIVNKPCDEKYFLEAFYENKPELFYIGAINVLNTCVLCHPTVMFKREVFDRLNLYYNEDYGASEGQELWARAVLKTTLAVLNKPLLKYRIHETNMTDRLAGIGAENLLKIKTKLLNTLLPYNNAHLETISDFERESYKINCAINNMNSIKPKQTKIKKKSIAEQIFSIKNSYCNERKHKVITIFGIEIKFNCKNNKLK